MTRRKTSYYEFSSQADNVLERGKALFETVKGNWKKAFFLNENPITLELACGKGEYSIGFGALFPERNFVGVDIKGDRLARGSKIASAQNLRNVGFLRAGIRYLEEFFEEGEVSEIWIVHPEPHVRKKEVKKRLTNPYFQSMYNKLLDSEGILHLKTDSVELYQYSLEALAEGGYFQIVEATDDLHNSPLLAQHYGVQTHYERIFISKGLSIHYIKAVKKG
jgi:tRNA (guanine-N7-)-methyltransferase